MQTRTLLAIGLLIPGILILAGCASLSKNQCLNADWYAVGLEDGAVGRPLERLSAGYQRGRELHDLTQRLTEVRNQIARTKEAIAAGTPNPAALAMEIVRLEDLTREAQELEWRISRASNP